MCYLPLLEPRPSNDDQNDNDDDFADDPPKEEPVDLVLPLKKSLKLIAREVNHHDVFHSFFFFTFYGASNLNSACIFEDIDVDLEDMKASLTKSFYLQKL